MDIGHSQYAQVPYIGGENPISNVKINSNVHKMDIGHSNLNVQYPKNGYWTFAVCPSTLYMRCESNFECQNKFS